MSRKQILAVLLALIMVFCLAGCGSQTEKEPTVNTAVNKTVTTLQTGQTLTCVRNADAEKMEKISGDERTIYVGAYGDNYVTSTLAAVGYNNVIAVSCIYDTLFSKDYGTGEIKPLIAESYEFIPDDDGVGTTLHVVIRKEAHFQSGEPITAEDCYYATIDRVVNVGTVRSYLGSTVDVENSYFEGDYDLYIKLKEYNNTVVGFLTALVVQVSNHSFEQTATDNDMWDNVDGSGPFIVEEQISGESVLLKVDDNYWGWGIVAERPNYDYLKVRFYTDSTVMMIDYKNGVLDCCLGPNSVDVSHLLEEGLEHNITRVISTGNYTVMCLPTYNKVFEDLRVREALFCAIDTEGIAKAAYGDLGITMNAYVSSMAPYRKEYQVNRYDPERAAQLLKEAGIKEGQLELYTVVAANDTNGVTLAELIRSFLADVGITLKIDTFDFPTALSMQRGGQVDLCLTTFYTSNGDISGCLVQLNEGSYNQAAWVTQLDEELAAKMHAGLITDDKAEAEELYGWIQDWIDENMWYLPIVETNAGFVCRDYINADGIFELMHGNDIRNICIVE